MSRPARELADARDARRIGVTWMVTSVIRGPWELEPDSPEVAGLGGIVSGASRLDGGNGWRFRPRTLWRRGPTPVVLTSAELAGLWPTPWSPWPEPAERGRRRVPRLLLGWEENGGAIDLPIEAGNGRHTLILGESGMGKSTLLATLAGRAVAVGSLVVLDPIGDTVRSILGTLPSRSVRSALWISPRDSPVAINALSGVSARAELPRERAIGEIVDALRRVRSARYDAGPFWGPRVEEVVHWAIAVAAGLEGGTLASAGELLSEGSVPGEAGLGPPGRKALFELRVRRAERPDEVEGGRRLLAELHRAGVLRRMLSEPRPRWTLAAALRPGAVTLISGDAAAIGESSSRTLLSLYLALLWSALLDRPGAPTPVFVLLDEVGWFANQSLVQMLRLGRRFGLHAILAGQSLATLSEETREAVLTNTSEFVLFRGSPSESREFERWGTAATLDRLVSLPRGMAAVLVEKGRRVGFVRFAPPRTGADRSDRFEEARTRARPFWARDATASVDDPAIPRPSDVPSPIPPEVRAVAVALQCTLAAKPGETVPIALGPWRAESGLDEETVRRAGPWLMARGIVRSDRTGGATRWLVDRGRMDVLANDL